MTAVKDSGRPYSSPLRDEQAARTRRAVLAAARELFLAQGYGATTLDQVASLAGVSKPTVFAAVGNKQTLLAAVRDVALAGDDEPVSVEERPAVQLIRAEPDPYRVVELLARHVTAVGRRYALLDDVVHGAAASGEPGLRELWETSEKQRLVAARRTVADLGRKGSLRDGLDPHSAADELWLLMAPSLYHRLVHVRKWSTRRFESWLAERLTRLLPPRPAPEAAS
ncbi:MAG: putative TetR family transcriptional regulator [Pseudonocardiales bacterium]|nr:putative TetR family transcriptional regulator [Pseudonocardiales bacterium]